MFVPSRGTMDTTDYGVSPTFLLLLSQSGISQFTFRHRCLQFTFLTGVYQFTFSQVFTSSPFLTGCLPVHLSHRCLPIHFLTGVYQFTFLTGVYQFTFLTGSALTCWTHTVCHQHRDTLNTEYSVGIIFYHHYNSKLTPPPAHHKQRLHLLVSVRYVSPLCQLGVDRKTKQRNASPLNVPPLQHLPPPPQPPPPPHNVQVVTC